MMDRRKFDEVLRRHLSSELGRLIREKDCITEGTLTESEGVFDGCVQLARSLLEKSIFWFAQGKPGFTLRLKGNQFIDSICVRFVDGNMSYYHHDSVLDKNGRFNPLNISLSTNAIKGKYIDSLMHEITHAYEDAMRRQNGAASLADVSRDSGYSRNNVGSYDINNVNTDVETAMSYMLYFFANAERNAYIVSIRGALENYNGYFKDANDVYRYIRMTPAYNWYSNSVYFARYIYNLTDPDMQRGCLAIAQKLSGNNYGWNFNSFRRWLKKKIDSITKKFETILPKMAAEFVNSQYDNGRMKFNSRSAWLKSKLRKRQKQ